MAIAAQPLVEEWSLSDVFTMPESAAFDPQSQHIFVSNVNEYAKDGNGFVSRLSADGSEVELKWLTGLNSPTGLTVHNDLLYVVDYDQLLVVNIASGEIVSKVTSPHEKPSLNDVAVSISGEVFVSGSSSAAIYQLEDNSLTIWKQDTELLNHANGLLVDGDKLVFGGEHWRIFDLSTRQLSAEFKAPTPKLVEIDGITSDGCGGYLITLIDDKRIWRVSKSGEALPLSDMPLNGIDLSRDNNKLYVPTVGGGLSVLSLHLNDCSE